MGLTSLFSRFFGQSKYYLSMVGDKGEQWVSITGKESDLYAEIPQLKAVIDRRSSMLSNGKWKLYRDDELVEDSELIAKLNLPNPLQARNEFLTNLETQLCLYGNSFTYKNQPLAISEVPVTLYNLPSRFMKVNKTGKLFKQTEIEQIVQNYKVCYPNKANDETFETKDVLHINFPNPDDPIIGISPLVSLKMPISNIKGAYKYRNTILYKKGALGILSNRGNDGVGAMPLKKDDRERIEKQYQKDYGVGNGQQSIMITDSSLSWTPMSYPTKDLLLFEEIDKNMLTIIDAFGLDVNIFSSEKGTTFSNLYEGIKGCYENTIIPHANTLANSFGRFLKIADNEKLELSYDHLPILQKDKSKEAEILQKKSDAYQKFVAAGMEKAELDLIFPVEDLIEYL